MTERNMQKALEEAKRVVSLIESDALTEEQKKYADYNKDGKITPTDYALIKEYIMRQEKI